MQISYQVGFDTGFQFVKGVYGESSALVRRYILAPSVVDAPVPL